MKISHLRKIIRIHWLLLGLLLFAGLWLCIPEKNATAQAVEQRFSSPSGWIPELTMGQGWGPEHPRMLANVNGDAYQDVVGFGIHGVWRSLGPPTHSLAFVLADFGYESGWRVAKHVRTMGDINADQYDDIVGFGDAGVFRALSNGSGFGPATFVVADFGYEQGWRVDKHVRLLADVNADKRKDIIGFGNDGVWLSIATSGGDFSAPQFVIGDFGFNQGWTPQNHVRTAADVNGDQRYDIVGFGDHGVWIALSNGNGFDAPQFILADLALYAGGWQVSKHPRLLTDINNDTFEDIVAFGDYGVSIAYSMGNGFAAPQLVLGDFGYLSGWRVDRHPRYVADLNNDGYKDIVGFGHETIWRALGGPNGFTSIRGVLRALTEPEFPYGINNNAAWAPRLVGDVTGDGMADLVAFGDTHLWVARSSDLPPHDPPKAPSDVQISASTATSLSFKWQDNSTNERHFFTYFGKSGAGFTRIVRAPESTTAHYSNLEPDTRYCFIVEAENIWGISTAPRETCGWTQKEVQPTPTPTPTPQGFSRIDVVNCDSAEHTMYLWTFDHSTQLWTQHGKAPSLWTNGSCPTNPVPFKVPLQDGHLSTLVAVDPELCGGQNNPLIISCQASVQAVPGLASGPPFPHFIH